MRKSLYFRFCKYRHILSSLYFNVHYLGWKQGLKLPIIFMSPIKFRDMKGKILLKGDVRHGQIAIGIPGNEMFDYSTKCIWSNQGGTVEFEGSFGTNPGASFVIRRGAILRIGNRSSLGQNLRILCSIEILIGDELVGSWDVTIMDTDSHYFDVDGKLSEFSNRISIGNHCFIGSGVSILKGTSIADNVVIASRAVVSGKLLESGAMYAGVPAKIKKHNIKYLK